MENTHKRLQLLEVAFMSLATTISDSLPADKQDEVNRMMNDYMEALDDQKVYDR